MTRVIHSVVSYTVYMDPIYITTQHLTSRYLSIKNICILYTFGLLNSAEDKINTEPVHTKSLTSLTYNSAQ